MTHKDIYTKFMIEYDKANVTSSYPSLTEYEVATVLDKAYHALIAQKVTGNNVRRVALEGDLKNISDIAPLITTSNTGALTHVSNSNVVYRTIPEDMLYFVSGSMTQAKANTMDTISPRPLPLKLVNHQIADKFIVSAYNMPWIKTPVCYIEDKNLYIVYDSVNTPNITNASITYIKTPNKFVKDIKKFNITNASNDTISYFEYNGLDDLDNIYNTVSEAFEKLDRYPDAYIKLRYANGDEQCITNENVVVGDKTQYKYRVSDAGALNTDENAIQVFNFDSNASLENGLYQDLTTNSKYKVSVEHVSNINSVNQILAAVGVDTGNIENPIPPLVYNLDGDPVIALQSQLQKYNQDSEQYELIENNLEYTLDEINEYSGNNSAISTELTKLNPTSGYVYCYLLDGTDATLYRFIVIKYFEITAKKPLIDFIQNGATNIPYLSYKDRYTFECNDTMAEELISLAVAFALENVESQRLNSKLNMRGLEA